MIWIIIIAAILITIATYNKRDEVLTYQVDSYGGIIKKYNHLVSQLTSKPNCRVYNKSRDKVFIKWESDSFTGTFIITELHRKVQIEWIANLSLLGSAKKKWVFENGFSQYKMLDEIMSDIEIILENKLSPIIQNEEKPAFDDNVKRWDKIKGEANDMRFSKVIDDFFIYDNIDFEKFIENQKANEICKTSGLSSWEMANSLSAFGNSEKINSTPTFREYFSENVSNRKPNIPEWFYIAYPDVEIWFRDKMELIMDIVNENDNYYLIDGKINDNLLRLKINEYLKYNSLECA
jgi:hypothetical protein